MCIKYLKVAGRTERFLKEPQITQSVNEVGTNGGVWRLERRPHRWEGEGGGEAGEGRILANARRGVPDRIPGFLSVI